MSGRREAIQVLENLHDKLSYLCLCPFLFLDVINCFLVFICFLFYFVLLSLWPITYIYCFDFYSRFVYLFIYLFRSKVTVIYSLLACGGSLVRNHKRQSLGMSFTILTISFIHLLFLLNHSVPYLFIQLYPS